jgi:hypothetical protein
MEELQTTFLNNTKPVTVLRTPAENSVLEAQIKTCNIYRMTNLWRHCFVSTARGAAQLILFMNSSEKGLIFLSYLPPGRPVLIKSVRAVSSVIC